MKVRAAAHQFLRLYLGEDFSLSTMEKPLNVAGKPQQETGSPLILLDEISKSNVIVLEDELLMSSLLLRYLDGIAQTSGLPDMKPLSLTSGWELLKLDLSHVRVAIVDLLLPQITGVDLIRDFRHRFPQMGLVPISGMATAPMKRQLKELLDPDFNLLEKPLRKEAFIQAFLKAWHYREESPSKVHLDPKPFQHHPADGAAKTVEEEPIWSSSVTNTSEIRIERRRSIKKKQAA